jgi:hypothetical protein
MVHIVRPVWDTVGEANQLGRAFPRLTYTTGDADALALLEDAPRHGDLLSYDQCPADDGPISWVSIAAMTLY